VAQQLSAGGMVRLEAAKDGKSAGGRFDQPMTFMDLRGQRRPKSRPEKLFTAEAWEESRDRETDLDLSVLEDFHAGFALGLHLPGVIHHQERDTGRWWFSAADSLALVDGSEVAQWGPRNLFDEVEKSMRWWREAGEPDTFRFGLTVTAEGQPAWLDDPAVSWPV
jgi:hypothetical protein